MFVKIFHHRDTEAPLSFTEKSQILSLPTPSSDRVFSKPKSSPQSKSPSRFPPVSSHSSPPRHIFPLPDRSDNNKASVHRPAYRSYFAMLLPAQAANPLVDNQCRKSSAPVFPQALTASCRWR